MKMIGTGFMSIAGRIQQLPTHLAERTRVIVDIHVANRPGFVLYWMRTALRVEENPALDVARLWAAESGVPLLVYHGLSQNYEYASDRHHTFIMQAARDLQRDFANLNIDYAFHLERPDHDGNVLRELANKSSVVVTEDMPTHAPRKFLRALAWRSQVPIVAVDTACVVPMQLVGKACERAFQFREKTKSLYEARVKRAWPAIDGQVKRADLSLLPVEPVDLLADEAQSPNFPSPVIADWVAKCEIDHTIGPVVDTVGGSSAGYARWNRFCDDELKDYAKNRNNALLNGVSRMSAYLHYGMVSPMRLAREAAEKSHAGAEKFLDELLIWRELAYCFCRFRPGHEQWSVLPKWARDTLVNHQSDPRSTIYSWEQLARGETNDPLWNAAQKSLLIHGELHNNVRMTWGKAVLNWTQTPMQALTMLVDLNHRYALDGRDPASYGGILWCLGQFDRPFQPEQAIFGTVRPRPSAYHAQRLDVAQYAAKTTHSRSATPPRIAIIGAGISGSMAARTLVDHGLSVTLFEKSRGAGGRMSNRRGEYGSFDHGAQYFTARDPLFKRYVRSWMDEGMVAEWPGDMAVYDRAGEYTSAKSIARYVGVPGMSAIAKHLSAAVELRTMSHVGKIVKDDRQFALLDQSGEALGEFDRIIVTVPAPQAAEILQSFPELKARAQSIEMHACWAVVVQFKGRLAVPWSGAFVNAGPLRWIARMSTKPGCQSGPENVVLHASPEWSEQHLEAESELVVQELLKELEQTLGLAIPDVSYADAHRWRFSIPAEPAPERCLANAENTILACGDWAGGPRVEGAFLSGCAAAGRILGSLPAARQPTQTQLSLF